jgi:hypothetical protein
MNNDHSRDEMRDGRNMSRNDAPLASGREGIGGDEVTTEHRWSPKLCGDESRKDTIKMMMLETMTDNDEMSVVHRLGSGTSNP